MIQAEQAESNGDVVMTQNGSLVYYAILVNDVYAYFLTDGETVKSNRATQTRPSRQR